MRIANIMNGATIKRIAVITMLIDHIGAAFFYVFTSRYDGMQAFAGADVIYNVLRIIGRTAFPLFCFLLAEGFLHTRSVRKYIARLFFFAIVSEVPFDLAFYDSVWSTGMQNVFFTLLLGVLAMSALRQSEKVQEQKNPSGQWYMALGWFFALLCCLAAQLLRTDYAAVGVVLILIFYAFREQRVLSCLAGYVAMCFGALESWCFPAFLLIPKYNGERGKGSKYFFYVFYPAHLLVLAGIRIILLKQ